MTERPPRTAVWHRAVLFTVLAAPVVACASWLGLARFFHDRLADEVGARIATHAETELGLVCDGRRTRRVGTILGGGGGECDVGMDVGCAGRPDCVEFFVPPPRDGTGIAVQCRIDGDTLVLTGYYDSLEPGGDIRCW